MKFFGAVKRTYKKNKGNKTKQNKKKIETKKDMIYTEIGLIWKR